MSNNTLCKLAFLALFVFLLLRGLLLIFPDLNLAYPFLAPDSYDWIANGLHYEGYSVYFSVRSPGLPLIIAFLDNFGILKCLPVLNQLVLLGLLVFTYRISRIYFSRAASFIIVVILFFNFFINNLSLYILADLYAVIFIVAGYYFYLRANRSELNYIAVSLFFSLSFIFQYAVVCVVPAVIAHFLVYRKSIRLKYLIGTILPPLFIIGGWLLYKNVTVGSFLYSGVQQKQVELLRPHLSSLLFYAVNIISVLGIPVFIILLIGLAMAWGEKDIQLKSALRLNLLLLPAWILFWVFLYTWNDRRFVLYLLFFLALFIAIPVERGVCLFRRAGFKGRIALLTAFFVLIYGSYIPYDSCFTLDRIKIAGPIAVKFISFSDPATHNANIKLGGFRMVRDSGGFNPVNLLNIKGLRRYINYGELAELRNIQREVESANPDVLCIAYDKFSSFKWYIDKNRYGNYFRRKIYLYPECGAPNLTVKNGELHWGDVPAGRNL